MYALSTTLSERNVHVYRKSCVSLQRNVFGVNSKNCTSEACFNVLMALQASHAERYAPLTKRKTQQTLKTQLVVFYITKICLKICSDKWNNAIKKNFKNTFNC